MASQFQYLGFKLVLCKK